VRFCLGFGLSLSCWVWVQGFWLCLGFACTSLARVTFWPLSTVDVFVVVVVLLLLLLLLLPLLLLILSLLLLLLFFMGSPWRPLCARILNNYCQMANDSCVVSPSPMSLVWAEHQAYVMATFFSQAAAKQQQQQQQDMARTRIGFLVWD